MNKLELDPSIYVAELAQALEAAPAASKEFDKRVAKSLNIKIRPYTESMDIAVQALSSDWWWEVSRRKNIKGRDFPNPNNGKGDFAAAVGRHDEEKRTAAANSTANTPALALCAAIVRAVGK